MTIPAATLAPSELDYPYLQGRGVLVTGATGFIGRRLVRRLISAGACVRVLVRPTSNLQVLGDGRNRLEVCQGDLKDADSLKASVRGAEIVFHLANSVGRTWEETRQATVRGTQCFLESAREAGVQRFIYLSSMSVYDFSRMKPGAVVDENAPLESEPRIRNDYARSKCEAEEVVRRYLRASEMTVTIVRPGAVYGPQGAPHIPTTIRVVADRVAFAIGGGQRPIPLVYVDDLVDALLRMPGSAVAAGKIYNVAADTPVSERVYALKYLKTQGRRVVLVPLPRMPFLWAASLYDWALRLSRRKKDSAVLRSLRRVTNPVCFSAAAVANDLGWRARTKLDEGIRASIHEAPGATH
jgi:nucleoside-diphosphate-sugar epimerase